MTTKINYNQIKGSPVNVLDYGAVADGSGTTGTNNAVAIQAALDAGAGGTVVIPPGSYLIDSLYPASNTTLFMYGATLLMKAHTTSHNSMLFLGNATTSVTGVKILGGKLVGNSAAQTYAAEEWSHGVFVRSSKYCKVEDVEITDCAGDAVSIGYEAGRNESADHNIVEACYLHDNGRNSVAVTYGSENQILNNRAETIDLELDITIGSNKNNIVQGNVGTLVSTNSLTENATIRISNLSISIANLNTNPGATQGTIIDGNVCYVILAQFSDSTIVTNNVVLGSTTGVSYLQLVDLAASNNAVVSGNLFLQNAILPTTSLTSIIRTRGCDNLQVTGNTCPDLSGIPFHGYVSSTYPAAYVDATSGGGRLVLQTYTTAAKSTLTSAPSTCTPVQFTTTGTLPTGLTTGVTYYAIWIGQAGNQVIRIATTLANAISDNNIAYTNAGTGDHLMSYVAQANSHNFQDNVIPATATYRNAALNVSEWGRFRIDQVSAGSLTATQLAGVPHTLAVSRTSGNMLIEPTGGSPLYAVLPQCNATTSASLEFTHMSAFTRTMSGSNSVFTLLTYAPAAGAVSLSAFSFASGGGTGTFFVDTWY